MSGPRAGLSKVPGDLPRRRLVGFPIISASEREARAVSSEVDPGHAKKMRPLGKKSRFRGEGNGSRPLPSYYFHVVEVHRRLDDDEGGELPSLKVAVAEAELILREIRTHDRRDPRGGRLPGRAKGRQGLKPDDPLSHAAAVPANGGNSTVVAGLSPRRPSLFDPVAPRQSCSEQRTRGRHPREDQTAKRSWPCVARAVRG
jgi:hypothetical protein